MISVTPYGVILAGFVALLAAGLALEALGRADRAPFRPLNHLLEVVMASRSRRWLVLGAWLWVGFHFLAR